MNRKGNTGANQDNVALYFMSGCVWLVSWVWTLGGLGLLLLLLTTTDYAILEIFAYVDLQILIFILILLKCSSEYIE